MNRWEKELIEEDSTGDGCEFGWYGWRALFGDLSFN